MNIPVDTKINMSLDDLVKSKQKANKGAGKKVKMGMAKINLGKGMKGNRNMRGGKPAAGNNNGNAMQVDNASNNKQHIKIAQNVGAAKAKRAAKMNKNRGLNLTGVASQAEIKKSVQKETNKAEKKSGLGLLNKVKAGNAMAQPAASTVLKISFNASDLKKTTDKNVLAQIGSVLSKGRSKNTPRGVIPVAATTAPQSRQVSIAHRGKK